MSKMKPFAERSLSWSAPGSSGGADGIVVASEVSVIGVLSGANARFRKIVALQTQKAPRQHAGGPGSRSGLLDPGWLQRFDQRLVENREVVRDARGDEVPVLHQFGVLVITTC